MKIRKKLVKNIADFIGSGSGCIFPKIIKTRFRSTKFNPLRKYGSGQNLLPRKPKNAKSRMSIQNKDDRCFSWCHPYHILDKESTERIKNPQSVLNKDKKIRTANVYISLTSSSPQC